MLLELSSISDAANGGADKSIDGGDIICCGNLLEMGSVRKEVLEHQDWRAVGESPERDGRSQTRSNKHAEEGPEHEARDWFQEWARERRERESEGEERARLVAERDRLADLVKNLGSHALAERADEVSLHLALPVLALINTLCRSGLSSSR